MTKVRRSTRREGRGTERRTFTRTNVGPRAAELRLLAEELRRTAPPPDVHVRCAAMTLDAVRERWAAGEPAVNAWVMHDDVAVATALAETGFDGVVADLQHGRMTETSLEWFATEIEAADAVPMVRLRWNSPAEIMRALDLGVRGVIAPMVGSADEAAALVSAARSPPLGTRSYGPIAGAFGAGAAHVAEANRRILVFAMIETVGGLADVDAIAATPGLDGL